MTGERARRLRELFDQACDLPADERDRFLQNACGDDAALRGELEALLRRDERADNPLDGPFLRGTENDLPERIGPFLVTRRIGSGSAGTVFAARQHHPAREVAIKLLRPGLVDEDALRRFRLEVDILGRLRHENVARIFEAGEIDLGAGVQPYLVMELIDGVSPLEYARKRGLGRDERLHLLARICDGVGHAHARGVIHRDLKAANILVDANGQPRIVDFGIARLDGAVTTREAQATRAGQLLGTLETMSPEQARGESHAVDTRSDVYALGVIGYELLSGRPPYALQNLDLPDALRVIRDQPAPPLGRLDPGLRGDVEVVLGKALRKDPEQRYASASELGEELRRCLRDEPITARPPSTRHQIARFARQNRTLVGGVLVAAGALLVAVVSVSMAWFEAQASAREREAALVESQEVTRFLEELLRSADPELHGPDVAVKDVLADASARIAADLTQRPALAGRLLATTGASYLGLGDHEAALEVLGAARRHLESAHGALDPRTLDVRRLVALALSRAGRHPQAVEEIRAVEEDVRAVLGPSAEITLATALDHAMFRSNAGHTDGVLDALEALVAECEGELGADHPTTLRGRIGLGEAHLRAQALQEAGVQFGAAFRARSERLGETHPDTRHARTLLALVRMRQGKVAEATALHQDDVRAFEDAYGAEHPRTLCAVARYAQFLHETSRHQEALPLVRRCHRGLVARFGERHAFSVETGILLGVTLVTLGRTEEAAPIVSTSRDLALETLGRKDDRTLIARTAHAALLRDRGDVEGALAEFLSILEIRREPDGDALQLVMILCNVARTELDLRRWHAAEEHLVEATIVGTERLGARHPETLVARSALARALLHTSRVDEALAILDDVCSTLHGILGPLHIRTIYADVSRAEARLAAGDAERAVIGLTDTLGRCEDILGRSHHDAVMVSCLLATALRSLGRHDEAEVALRARIDACGPLPDEDPRARALSAALSRNRP